MDSRFLRVLNPTWRRLALPVAGFQDCPVVTTSPVFRSLLMNFQIRDWTFGQCPCHYSIVLIPMSSETPFLALRSRPKTVHNSCPCRSPVVFPDSRLRFHSFWYWRGALQLRPLPAGNASPPNPPPFSFANSQMCNTHHQ